MQALNRTGFILYVHAYMDCLQFYRDVLRLPVLFEQPSLCCFAFGAAYLMIEVDDETPQTAKLPLGNRSCLRLHVADVRAAADRLLQYGIAVDYQEHHWGTVAKFRDPDGNLIAYKDAASFDAQIAGGSRC